MCGLPLAARRTPYPGNGPRNGPPYDGRRMILRRFGSRIHQVTPNFDARAMTEISFLRGAALEDSADE